MNAYQKATILVSFSVMPLALLFMNAMNYRGVGLTGAAWLAGTAGLLYALRTANASVPLRVRRSGYEVAPRLHASSTRRGFGSRGLR